MKNNDQHVTKKKACELLGITYPTLRKWIEIGYIEDELFGLTLRIRMTEIERILKK